MNGLKIFTLINAVLICFFSVLGFFMVPEFARLFEGFAVELPIATSIVVKSYKYWAIALLVPAFIYFRYLTLDELPENIVRNLSVINASLLIFLALLLPLLVYTMYLPIFEMESATSQ